MFLDNNLGSYRLKAVYYKVYLYETHTATKFRADRRSFRGSNAKNRYFRHFEFMDFTQNSLINAPHGSICMKFGTPIEQKMLY